MVMTMSCGPLHGLEALSRKQVSLAHSPNASSPGGPRALVQATSRAASRGP